MSEQKNPVELYVGIRWTISGSIFLVFVWLTGRWKQISILDFLRLCVLGIFGYGLASLGTLYGLKTGGVANFALMSTLGPIVLSILSILYHKEKPNRLFYSALPVCFLGLVCVVSVKYQVSNLKIACLSALFILAGYFLEVLVFVNSKTFKSRVGISQYLAITQMSAALFFWILQMSFFKQVSMIDHLTNQGLAAALFVSLVACVLCYAILYWLLERIEGHRLALFDGIHALSASLFGYFVFQESITPLVIMGGCLIFCGLAIGNWKK